MKSITIFFTVAFLCLTSGTSFADTASFAEVLKTESNNLISNPNAKQLVEMGIKELTFHIGDEDGVAYTLLIQLMNLKVAKQVSLVEKQRVLIVLKTGQDKTAELLDKTPAGESKSYRKLILQAEITANDYDVYHVIYKALKEHSRLLDQVIALQAALLL